MLVTGKLEVFKNQNGYNTAVLKAFGDNNELKGKTFVSCKLPESVKIEDGQTLTLDVKKGYLNAVYVGSDAPFTKLEINISECEVVKVFPEQKKSKKTSKKGAF